MITDNDVPQHLSRGLRDYAQIHQRPGGFLQACLENNLYEAAIRADPTSLAGLRAVMIWIKEELPAEAWGSPEAVAAWILAWPDEAL